MEDTVAGDDVRGDHIGPSERSNSVVQAHVSFIGHGDRDTLPLVEGFNALPVKSDNM